ncbi:hypothetical protein QYF61_015226 [Mycteria americana]|uniref:Uncharacterized protein n=1 Tax=Mycteria americana TaxID=33587 RepID=A0AAN7PJX5_MYCAM|nr:hypothetical protein QYF61_015226 [Mycteria americana]
MPSSCVGAEPICISGVTGGSQQLTVLEAKVSLTGNEWQKHPTVTGPEAPCILGIDYLRRGYFKDSKGGNTAEDIFEKGKKIVQIPLKDRFVIKQSKVKGPAQEIQVLGIKWQDGRHQIPMDVINKITAVSPPTGKKETQAFLGIVGFWRMHIPNYSLITSSLYQVTWKKNHFKWSPEQQEVYEQIKQEIVHEVGLVPVWAGQDLKNVLYTAARENAPTWSLWQKAPGES